MPEPTTPTLTPGPSAPQKRTCADTDKILCERCGAQMCRMHAVWRCPACRFKTECCG